MKNLLLGSTLLAITTLVPAPGAGGVEAADPIYQGTTLVLTAEQLDNGHPRLSEALAAAVPSLTSPLFGNKGTSSHARTIMDHGLTPDQLLILVNGERRYKSAIAHVTDTPAQGSFAVDLDAIPLAAIERIEISRGNASVRHGSAGVAGVVNVITKQRRSGGDLYANFGQHTTEISDVADAVGARFDNGAIVLGTAGDRNPDDGDGDNLRVGGSWGFAVGENGSVTAAASFTDRKRTSREGFSRGQLFPLQNGAFDQREITTNRLLQKFGDADTQELNFSIGLKQQVHGMTFTLNGAYAARTAKSFTSFQRPVDFPTSTTVFPTGFLPELTSDSDGLALTFQLAGAHYGWDWLATWHQGGDELDLTLQDSINLSLDSVASATTPTEFRIGNNESGIQEVSLKANRLLNLPFGTENRLSLGVDNQLSDHEIERGDVASRLAGNATDGGVVLPPGSAQVIGIRARNEFDEGRSSYGVFAELSSRWRDDLTTLIGARFTDYDDIDSEFDARAAVHWQPNAKTSVNAEIAKGHRAPDIGQRFYNGTFTRYFDQTLNEVEVFQSEDPDLAAFGGGALDAENSFAINVAASYTPSDALSLSARIAYLRIDDRIVLSEALSGANAVALLQSRDIAAERLSFYTNGADSDTYSLDVAARYRYDLPGSHLNFNIGASFFDTNASSTNPAVGRRVVQRLEEGAADNKVHFTTNWRRPRTDFEFRATWYGSATQPGDTAAEDHSTGSGLLLDLILQYDLNDQLTGTIGGLNLFDAYSDVFEPDTSLSPDPFEQPFSSYTPWGFNGRYVYFSLRATLP